MKALYILALAAVMSGCAAQKVSHKQVQVPGAYNANMLSCTGTQIQRRCRASNGHPAVQVKAAEPASPLAGAKR